MKFNFKALVSCCKFSVCKRSVNAQSLNFQSLSRYPAIAFRAFKLNRQTTDVASALIWSLPYMSHTVKIYDTCIGCTQCVRACPTDVLEMVPWDGCRAGQIASSPRTEDCVGCKRCETACPTDFLSIRVYLGAETTRSMGLAY